MRAHSLRETNDAPGSHQGVPRVRRAAESATIVLTHNQEATMRTRRSAATTRPSTRVGALEPSCVGTRPARLLFQLTTRIRKVET